MPFYVKIQISRKLISFRRILDSIVVSIPACHAGDRGSIPRRGDILSNLKKYSSEAELIYAIELFPFTQQSHKSCIRRLIELLTAVDEKIRKRLIFMTTKV